jgi:hypothetical protein
MESCSNARLAHRFSDSEIRMEQAIMVRSGNGDLYCLPHKSRDHSDKHSVGIAMHIQ